LLVSRCAATASLPAFAPRGLAQPFFDGWFIRLTDVEQRLSCALIVGSLRHVGAVAFSQHYIALSYCAASMARLDASAPDQLQSVHIFASPSSVQIMLDGKEMKGYKHETDWRAPAAGRCRLFEWKSREYGHLIVDNERVSINFTLPGTTGETVTLSANMSDGEAWGKQREREEGPEGWLGGAFVSFLLPCRYFVQSLRSQSTYCLRRSLHGGSATPSTREHDSLDSLQARRTPAASTPLNCTPGQAPAHEVWRQGDVVVEGRALGHVETNYGSSFPNGWIYIQGVGSGGVSVLVTGGEFGIGPVAPLTYIVAVRGPGLHLDFRTTDMSVVQVSFSCQQRIVRLVARGVSSYGRVDLLVRDGVQKHDRQPVWVPTRQGFSCQVLEFFLRFFCCVCIMYVCMCVCVCVCVCLRACVYIWCFECSLGAASLSGQLRGSWHGIPMSSGVPTATLPWCVCGVCVSGGGGGGREGERESFNI
jgi:hypothetical protein